MKSIELVRKPMAADWHLDRIRCSHHVCKHPHRNGIVVVPHPSKDLGIGLTAAIREQARIPEK